MPFSIAGPSGPALPSMDGINKAVDRISSGQRVNYQYNAAEGAISGRLDTAVGISTVSIRNAISQISSLQKADQTLGQASDIVERIQALSVQAGNATLSEPDQLTEQEGLKLLDEASALLKNAQFNGNKLFSDAGINIEGLQTKLDDLRSAGAPIDQDALASIQDDISIVRSGAEQNSINSRISALENEPLVFQEYRSTISDTDFAEEFANLLQEELIFKANVKVFNHRIMAEETLINMLSE